jgi:hypothetical protein
MRRWRSKLPPRVEMDQVGVRRFNGEKQVESVLWSDLASVKIRTTGHGPFSEDVFFLLVGHDGTGVAVGQGSMPDGLLQRLRDLPGFSDSRLIAAMGCTDDQLFDCWSRGESTQ